MKNVHPKSHSHFPILGTGVILRNANNTRIHINATGKSDQKHHEKYFKPFIYYTTTHPDAIVTYHVSDMIPAVHINASELYETNYISQSGGGGLLMSSDSP